MASIIKWAPLIEPFDDADRMFSEFFPALRGQNVFMPAIDMYEDKNNFIVEAQLAGIDPNNVDISVENDVLNIKGEGEKKSEVEDKNYYRQEIKRGSFYRSIPLPAHVLGDKATAISESGVLKITIPKAEKSKPNKIKIQSK